VREHCLENKILSRLNMARWLDRLVMRGIFALLGENAGYIGAVVGIATGGPVVSGGPEAQASGFGGSPEAWIAPLWQHYVLFGAIVLLTLSLYIFFESISLQRFAFHGIEAAPDPWSGLTVVVIGVPLIIFVLCGFGMMHERIAHPVSLEELRIFERDYSWNYRLFEFFIQQNPMITVPALALASVLPSALSVYKFVVVNIALRGRKEGVAPAKVGRAVVGIFFGAINFVASIATLIGFWKFMSR
jgi:hypothetical protein